MSTPTRPPAFQEVVDYIAREQAAFLARLIRDLGEKLGPGFLAPYITERRPPTGARNLEVPIAPAVSQTPSVAVGRTAPAYGTIDQAVGSPAVRAPDVAVFMSPYPQEVFKSSGPIQAAADSGILGERGFVAPWAGTCWITGTVAESSGPVSLQASRDGGQSWSTLNADQPLVMGAEFGFPFALARGSRLDVSVTTEATFQDLLILYQSGIPILGSQGFYGAVPEVTPGSTAYSGPLVPVSSVPQVIGSIKAGTAATASTAIFTFSVPAPGMVQVFGAIQSGSAYLTLAVENNQSGTPVFQGLNAGQPQTTGVWVAGSVGVAYGDQVSLGVSASCTLGSVRVLYARST